ncbi:MAG: hypothetical protein WCI22_17085 [Actinomycetota bacterium]
MSDPWEPATSKPGEMYTPEGQIKAFGALARGLKNDDPRSRRYRHQMQRTGLLIVGCAIALVAAIAIVTALF